ncbi:MAG: prolyl oligopeptidase family serine peptidase [Melioribacteraceae bacterium]
MLLCKPQINNEPTDEFYELACSEVEIPDRIWQRHIFWNYNVNKLFIPTSVDTKLESREGNGKISFELILPWADVRPYHPWISDGIGFNLSFVKAVEPEGTVWYQAVDDNSGREFSKRLYVPLRFRKPELKGDPQTFVATKEGHITEGQSLNATAVTISNKTVTENVNVFLGTGETLGMRELTSYECQPGITKKEFSLNSTQLIEGAYTICWNYQNKDSRGSTGLSVLQKFDEPELYNRLEKNSKHISKGSYNTIQFMIKELKGKIESLKTYETCVNERIALTNLMRMINLSDRGVDPFDDMRGFIRKAYQSKIDNSFQPYMVYLPENFDKSRKYPLMIFLHGSASDETNIQAVLSIIPKDFIAVGPFGRGKSNGFTMDHAQDDIAEVITAVEEDYSIDTTKILLTGFSMGGYGVYRTYYETPTRYKALAIFSGTPSVSIKNAPDFVDEKNLASFRNIPVFIFHGEKDMNCPASITKDVAEKLKKYGAQVELQIDPEKGHERPDDKTLDSYLKWVDRVLK